MRVVLVLNGPETSAERIVLARREVPLLGELRARGVRPAVVLFGDRGGLANDFRESGVDVDVISVPMAPRAASLRRMPFAVRRFRALLRDLEPDLVEATEPMPAIAAGLATGRRIVTLYRRQHQTGSWKLLAASRTAARLCTRTVVSSEAMRGPAAAADRVPLPRVLVAASGYPDLPPVPREAVCAARRGLGIPCDAPVVGAISRLRWEKGLDVLVAAASMLGERVHVVIAGSGPEEARLRAMARDSRARIHFLGHRDDVAVWYAAADAIAIPSRRESFGRTTIEAMIAARPIVASAVGGIPDAVRHDETGLLVPADDPRALATALERVLDDGALARRLAQAARAAYESRFTIAHMAASRRAMWDEALRSHSP
ncbi:MAG TPA: glycosyltransferase family 4 protein [Thermoanaerobaculia bacterium]|nr:glycosyltransferase family 4 protein [Thermoanaerobaculia bacterium]